MTRSTTFLVLGVAVAVLVTVEDASTAIAAEHSPVPAVTAATAPSETATANAPSANPLWGITLKQLSNTRDRPLFSPSRRPPPPPAPPPVAVAPAPVEMPKEPEAPQLALVGTIVNHDESYGIFMDQTVSKPVRIRIGSSHRGWMLLKVGAGEAALEKDGHTANVEFPKTPGEPPRRREGGAGFPAAGSSLRGAPEKSESQTLRFSGEQQVARRGTLSASKPFGVLEATPTASPAAERH